MHARAFTRKDLQMTPTTLFCFWVRPVLAMRIEKIHKIINDYLQALGTSGDILELKVLRYGQPYILVVIRIDANKIPTETTQEWLQLLAKELQKVTPISFLWRELRRDEFGEYYHKDVSLTSIKISDCMNNMKELTNA